MKIRVVIPLVLIGLSFAESAYAMTDAQAEHLANEAYKTGNIAESLKLYDAAKSGDVAAQSWLGAYLNAIKNYTRAIHWYKKAAAQGDAMAENNLGNDYHQGQGVPQNYVKANYWFKKAAAQGFAMAEYNLGVAYHQGQGVPQNYVKANYWFKKAAAQGFARAENHLGSDYYHGKGCPQNYAKAIYWIRKAAAQGDPMAEYDLGFFYYKGRGVPQDRMVAIRLWERVAAQGGHAGRLAQNTIELAKYNGHLSYFASDN